MAMARNSRGCPDGLVVFGSRGGVITQLWIGKQGFMTMPNRGPCCSCVDTAHKHPSELAIYQLDAEVNACSEH